MKATAVLFAILLGIPALASAHETDQFAVPPDRRFADLGDFFNRWAYRAIAQGVNVTNAEIRQGITHHRNASEMEELEKPDRVTLQVRTQWPWSVTQIEDFERVLRSPEMARQYPGRVVCYGDRFSGEYQWAFLPIDIRGLAHVLFFSSTIKVYGVYLGTDKLGHFTDEGISYYFAYRAARDAGLDEKDSVARAVTIGTTGLMSEAGMLGLLANADYANGDVAANFAGFLFYRNLTEPMRLKGQWQPAMLVRDGPYWKIADDVRPDSGFFARFISDHLDEALNPGYFDPYLRPVMRRNVRGMKWVLLQHYADESGKPRGRDWFDRKLRELNTYWGVDYGHMGRYDDLVSIGSSCFGLPADRPVYEAPNAWGQFAGDQDTAAPGADETAQLFAAPQFGQSELHQIAAQARGQAVADLIVPGRNPDVRDDFGRTPLHESARTGAEAAARRLLAAGADPDAVDDYGTTPLHLACREGRLTLVRLLLERGASIGLPSAAGTTPLHEAASAGDEAIVRLLMDHGAVTTARDNKRRTPADIALAHGFPELAALLRRTPGGGR